MKLEEALWKPSCEENNPPRNKPENRSPNAHKTQNKSMGQDDIKISKNGT